MPRLKTIPAVITLFILTAVEMMTVFPAYAQLEGLEVTTVHEIEDVDIEDGDIVVANENGIIKATFAYDFRLFGVIQRTPIVVYRRKDDTGEAVARYGIAQVNVTNINGLIKVGDYITSSELPGKGQKATQSGYVIGIALEDLNESAAQQIDYTPSFAQQTQRLALGKVTVAVKIEYAELSTSRSALKIFDTFNAAFFRSVKDPERFVQIFRYIAAALAVIISFVVGFVTFSRSIPKGVEAIGRNPLAQRAILISMVLNIFFILITASIGVLAALVILRF